FNSNIKTQNLNTRFLYQKNIRYMLIINNFIKFLFTILDYIAYIGILWYTTVSYKKLITD
ncbi:hypothetical protein DXA91_16660, partial [Clostridium sp. OF09-10]